MNVAFKARAAMRTRRWDRYWAPIRDENDCAYSARLRIEFRKARIAGVLVKAKIRSNGVSTEVWAQRVAEVLVDHPALEDLWG